MKASDDWQWQLVNQIRTIEQLEQIIALTSEERAAFEGDVPLSFAITPYYAQQLSHPALRKMVVPTISENHVGEGEWEDPLGEEEHRVAPHLIHTYPDKVLFLATRHCSTYCRYCTRSRLVGASAQADASFAHDIDYIHSHPEIRDVLISGGDPLTLTDQKIDDLLSALRAIPHVQTIRIGSKVPVVLPMRITDELCAILRKHEVWLSLHFIHPAEITTETQRACRKLSDAGIAMVSQTVLLTEINDDVATLEELFYGLLKINVKPYYLLQCDPVVGSAHFRTSISKGLELIQALHGRNSGLAVPQYVVDAPGGGGKIPLLSESQIRREGSDVIITNYQGFAYRYPDLSGV